MGMLIVDDSPRFLAQKQPKEALRVLSRLRGLPPDHPYIQHEMGNIERVLEDERQLIGSSSGLAIVKEAFAVKSYRRRSILCVTLMMCQYHSSPATITRSLFSGMFQNVSLRDVDSL